MLPPAHAEGAALRGLVVVGEGEELKGRGAVEARLERAPLHRGVRDVARPEAKGGGIDDLLAAVVHLGAQHPVAVLEAGDHPRHVLDLHGNAHPRLDEVAGGVAAQGRREGWPGCPRA